MSIADKLTYLNTTKQLLKTEINKINNVLDDNSTFRSYPQELFNGYIDILNNGTDTLWSNLEKVSQTGTEAVLENVENAPIKIELSGNITQETTSGKNIFNIIDYSNIAIGGSGSASNINKTSNIISFASSSESASSGVYISNSRLSSYIDDYNSETIYHVSADITTDVACNFKIGTNNSSYVSIPVGTTRLSNSIQASSLVFYVNAVVANIKISNIMISTNQDTSYEPYTGGVASPNPDYPQDIQVVKGNNVVSVSGKNLFDKENTAWYRNNDSRFVWENNANTTRIRTNSFKIEGGKTYVVSGLPSGISLTGVRTYEDDTPTGVSTGDVTRNGTVFTLGQNVKYIHLLFGGENFTDDTNVLMKNANIQLEEGSTTTEYQPFSKTDYPINLTTENLFDKDNANILNAWINANTKLITSSSSNRTIWIEVESNTTYKVKKIADTSSNGRFRVGTSPNLPVVGGTLAQAIQDDTAEEITITTGANDKYIAVFCYNTSSSITLEEILDSLEIKEANVSYSEMCKIGEYKDFFFEAINGNEYYDSLTAEQKNALNYGSWYLHKAIKKFICDGSLTYRKNVSNSSFYIEENIYNGCVLPANNYTMPQIIANQLKADTGRHVWYDAIPIPNTIGVYTDNTSNPRLNFGDLTVAELKAHLDEIPLVFYAPLITPVEEEITDTTLIAELEAIAKAKSVADKTYITQTNDGLPFILDVETIKKYEVA